VVVAVGESCTLPVAFELVVSVREVVASVAVMVTEVEFEACQLTVVLCPVLIEVGVAERVTLGAGGGRVVFRLLAQEREPQIAASRAPHENQRINC
jgi:hypothetical protein